MTDIIYHIGFDIHVKPSYSDSVSKKEIECLMDRIQKVVESDPRMELLVTKPLGGYEHRKIKWPKEDENDLH